LIIGRFSPDQYTSTRLKQVFGQTRKQAMEHQDQSAHGAL